MKANEIMAVIDSLEEEERDIVMGEMINDMVKRFSSHGKRNETNEHLEKLKLLVRPYTSSEIDDEKVIEELLCKVYQVGSAKDKAHATLLTIKHYTCNN